MPGSADAATLRLGLKGGVNLPTAAIPSADQYRAKSEERAHPRRVPEGSADLGLPRMHQMMSQRQSEHLIVVLRS